MSNLIKENWVFASLEKHKNTNPRRMEGRPHASQSCHCCPEISAVRKHPDRSSTSRQSAPSRGLWSPWCLWGFCTHWRLQPGRWLGKYPGARCCRSEGPRAELTPHRASYACPPVWVPFHWPVHCRSPCAPSLCTQKQRNLYKINLLFGCTY